jgi:hypothetical protein
MYELIGIGGLFLGIILLISMISFLIMAFRIGKIRTHVAYMHRLMKLDAIKKGLITEDGKYIGYDFDEANMDRIIKK